MRRRGWIGFFVAALAGLAFTHARAIDFDPNEVYDLVEPAWRVERNVRLVDVRDTPRAAAQILSDGIRLGETQFRQPPPEALHQSLEAWLASTAAQARPRELLTRGTVRLTRFEFRFVQTGVVVGDVARVGNLPSGSSETVDLLLRSLTKGKSGTAQAIVGIEIEAGGRTYAGNASSKLTAAPTSATTRATFQAAVDDLVRVLSADPDAPSAEPPPSGKKRR